ncbi:MAG TPA: hypothetical protein DIW44_02115 [Anaerolineaceae bacterium]|nr:hypothetical protein [Anaerolineaceae bacterium]
MGQQKMLQKVFGLLLIVSLVGCGSPSSLPSDATLMPSTPTPLLMTQTPLPSMMIMQEGNNLPRTLLQAKPTHDLANNRIGSLCHPPPCVRDETHINDEFFDLGLKGLLRITLNEIESYSVVWSTSEFTIAPIDDEWITSISKDITLAYSLTFWDKANHPNGWEGISSRFQTEEEIQHYLDYVRFIVNHFKDRIHYYEIWNEPNIGYPFQHIEPADYVNLVKQTIPVIREIDPEAKIIVGGVTALQSPEYREFLFQILESDIMPLVDVISWHPFFGVSPQYEDVKDYYLEYPSLVQQIKNAASAHGFVGEYSADELTWRTPLNSDEGQPWTYNEITAAKYYARGIMAHLGMDVSVGVMIDPRLMMIRSTTGNLCTLMVGAIPESLPIEIQSEAKNVLSYSFSLPNGDKLFVFWSNGAAMDDDPGLLATVTIPTFSNWEATGIDALYGIEQKLTTTNENDSMTIHDLMIKDYPIIIRLSERITAE